MRPDARMAAAAGTYQDDAAVTLLDLAQTGAGVTARSRDPSRTRWAVATGTLSADSILTLSFPSAAPAPLVLAGIVSPDCAMIRWPNGARWERTGSRASAVMMLLL